MKEDDIVYLPWSLVNNVVPPNSYFGEALRKEFDGILPYLELWPANAGIYARIIGIVKTAESPEQTVVSFTTFPVSTGGVKLLCMVFPGKVELVPVTDANILNAVTRNNAVDLNVVTDKGKSPTQTVKVKSTKELLNESLDLVFPGQYGWGNSYNEEVPLYIYWPEITITNSKKHSRKIYGLAVRVWFDHRYTNMTRNIEGKRLIVTTSDLESGYRHSHLGVGCRDFSAFCLGHSSMANMMMDAMSSCPPDWFYVFLIHLDQYVRWESIEGGPYIRMNEVKNRVPMPALPGNVIIRPETVDYVTGCVLPAITPAMITREVYPDGSVRYRLNTTGGAGKDLKETIDAKWPDPQRLDYSEQTGQYMQSTGRSNNSGLSSLISSHVSSPGIRTAELVVPCAYMNEDEVQGMPTIRVAPPNGYLPVILHIETLLNNKVPIQLALYYEAQQLRVAEASAAESVSYPF